MRLTYFQGLNCYYECIICIAGYYGLEPAAAFDCLWSETDFKYDPCRKVYLTKRQPPVCFSTVQKQQAGSACPKRQAPVHSRGEAEAWCRQSADCHRF